ncbi:hypothetical protein PYCCODRAFT_73928 [Trametes coccinea BRFM310]|uniref:Uncharacterized protein n=1 Tax=Trametes coccinea (strain BRFM310) TaxID=1353009 RepID=A0A1Y2IUQ3_TRAC3|nr:hypothetical protein PYCCODRAFT_73928 [Trametes coccinea BRFM310]
MSKSASILWPTFLLPRQGQTVSTLQDACYPGGLETDIPLNRRSCKHKSREPGRQSPSSEVRHAHKTYARSPGPALPNRHGGVSVNPSPLTRTDP